MPPDRQGKFEPVLVPQHKRCIMELDEKTLALYARGMMGTRDISAQLEELYRSFIILGVTADFPSAQ
ncbi:transposase [Synechocystis salina LEGE 06155]|nr:transposase [Synechocystis salina LEGE 06155]